jgi:hypothetical protein
MVRQGLLLLINVAERKMVGEGYFIFTKLQAKYCHTSEKEDLNGDSFLLL